jgi:predicted MFS family arabinose efflux permease
MGGEIDEFQRRGARASGRAGLRWELPARPAFWLTAVAFTLVMAVGTAPAPLWPLYQADGGLATTTITVLAGAVVVGATVSFLLLGHLSDRHGRRRVLVPFLMVSVAALLVMAAWPSAPGLGVGRVLTGLALGVTAPTATAYLIDLGVQIDGRRDRATTVATAANLGGLALGPVVAGALARFMPLPLVLPYVVLAALLSAAAAGMLACPETVPSHSAGARRSRFALLPGSGRRFAGAALAGFVSFAVTGIFAALGGIVVRGELRVGSVLVWGLTTGLVFAASAVAQLAAGAWPPRRLYATGTVLLPVGLALVVVSVADPRAVVYGAACVVTGAACGLLFKAGLVTSAAAAVPASRAGVLAVHFSVAYLGMGLGAVILAALQVLVSTPVAFGVLGAVFSGLAIVGAVATATPEPSWLGVHAEDGLGDAHRLDRALGLDDRPDGQL